MITSCKNSGVFPSRYIAVRCMRFTTALKAEIIVIFVTLYTRHEQKLPRP
jgi:hypothetical protein